MRALTIILVGLSIVAPISSEAQIVRSPGEAIGLDLTSAYGMRIIEFAQPEGFESAAVSERFGILMSTSGTASSLTYSTTDYGKFPRYRLTSGVVVNSVASWTTTAYAANQGQIRIDGGEFVAFAQVGIPIGFISGNRAFFGLFAGNAGVSGSTNPSALTNTVYLGFDAGETTWHVCSNDGGTATCVDLGLAISTTGMFQFELRMTGSGLAYRMKRMDVIGIDLRGTIATDLPTSTLPLRQAYYVSTGTVSGTAVVIEPKFLYLEIP